MDGKIKRAEAAVKKAEKVKVDYTADDADILEAEKAKKEAVETARKELDLYTDIKKAMTAKKVSENVDDERGNVPQEQPQTEAQNEAVRKFMEAPKVEGRRGSITLPNGEKIKGRYVAVPAMSLVPSHDPFNSYKPHEGAPLDANGHTVNDRDYATDKDAQQVTDAMGRDYGGQAISDIPVVNPDGRVISGNGRTMAGQLAAKNGTDGKYVEARNENAEGFGMKAEDLDKLDHARIVFIPDEPLPYDSATFAKFNRSREKSQSNTQQAISISKKLSSDEVGAIVSEIDGQGSLDAFFNNPKAINDLVKTLVQKGVIGQNEVAALLDADGERLSPQGKEFVKNLLLGGIFKEETISMMGIDNQLKNKVVNGIRSVIENMKLGEYSLRDEIDNAIQLLYNAKRSKMNVSDYLRQDDAFDESAREKYSQVAQALAQALEGNTALFRDLMREYNDVAKVRSTGESDMFGENLSREELVKQFLEISKIIKENDIKLYGKDERLKEGEGGNHAASDEEPAKETGGGNGEEKPTETQQQVDEAVKKVATEITEQTGVEVVTDEKKAEERIKEAEGGDIKKMSFGEPYDYEQYPLGRVEPGLADKKVDVVTTDSNHGFKNYNEAKTWAKGNISKTYTNEETGGKGDVRISNTAIDKFLSQSAVDKSDSKDVHMAVLKVLPEVLRTSIDVETHPDFVKGENGKRRPENGVNKDVLVHRCYGAVTIDGRIYRVKITLKEDVRNKKLPHNTHSYEATKIELLEGTLVKPEGDNPNTNNSITGAKLLENVGMSYNPSEKVLDLSKIRFFRTKDGEVYGFTDGDRIYLDTKKMKPETPLHEYTHLWSEALRRRNPKEWENVKSLFDKVEGLKEEVKKLYPELEGDDLYDEMIATFSGREGTKKLEDVV